MAEPIEEPSFEIGSPEWGSFFIEEEPAVIPENYVPPKGYEGNVEAMHIVDGEQLVPEFSEPIFERALQVEWLMATYQSLGMRLNRYDPAYVIFEEASTRTRSTGEMALDRMGYGIFTVEAGGMFSSKYKGESTEDEARVFRGQRPSLIYSRTKETGDALRYAQVMNRPFINGGDGKGEHPTQSFLDIYTIYKELGDRPHGLKLAMIGDLANGRTVKSLAKALTHYEDVELALCSPESLSMGREESGRQVLQLLEDKGVKYFETDNLEEAVRWAKGLYVVRLQSERLGGETRQERIELAEAMNEEQRRFTIGLEQMSWLDPDGFVMHPLPRVRQYPPFRNQDGVILQPEILPEIDSDPRAAYFRQADNGLPVRIALLETVLQPHYGVEGQHPPTSELDLAA